MFYCREEELQTMNRRYNKGQFECIVIYGRRRVGKTALINEFCRDAPAFRKDGTFHYYIFSKSGFTQGLLEAEKRGQVRLLTLDDLYQ